MAKLTGNKMENLFDSAPDQDEKKGTVKKAAKKAEKKADYKIVSVKVEAGIFAAFGAYCEQNGLVKSRAIGKAIEEFMENHAE